MRASRFIPSVKPWEWARQPSIWIEWALTAESAEASADKINQEHAAKKK